MNIDRRIRKRVKTLAMSLVLTFAVATSQSKASAQGILPKPQSYAPAKGTFHTRGRQVRVENRVGDIARNIYSEPWMAVSKGGARQVMIFDRLSPKSIAGLTLKDGAEAEAYQLHVSPDTILIRAASADGFRLAWATVRQLTTKKGVACCDVLDAPAYKWRSMMLDVSRHFRSIEFLKRQIDAMARYKFNRLHLHLTDAAGWRIEIKRYPRLTNLAAWRPYATWQEWTDNGGKYVEEGTPGAYGGYYTQDQLRELVSYAADRGITIVPEIEMPGHSEEVLAAYPELSCSHEPYKDSDLCPGSVATYDFMENVLLEVMDIFPSEYIHVGGDEAVMKAWDNCLLCQRMMKELHTDKAGLQAHLITHFGNFLNAHGRRLVGWDEVIASRLAPNTTVMVWRETDLARKAIEHGYDVVLSPGDYCYIDRYQDAPITQPTAMGGYLTLKKMYDYVPGDDLTADERRHITGLQANLWAEYIPSDEQMEYMFWPRAMAIAEIGWNGAEKKDYADFHRRALAECDTVRAMGIHAFDLRHEIGERKESFTPVKHKARGCRVTYNTPLHPKYTAGGEQALVDGVRGGWTYADKRWQGFTGTEGWCLDVTIDMGSIQKLHEVSVVFMQSLGPWIYYPTKYRVSLSEDGKTFTQVYSQDQPQRDPCRVGYRTQAWHGSRKARYVRVQGSCDTEFGWLFTDEIVVR